MDFLGATKDQIRQTYQFPAAISNRYGDATTGDEFEVGGYVLLFGYKPLGGVLKVVYVIKRRGDMQQQTLPDAVILPHLYSCRSGGDWKIVPFDPAPHPPPAINPPAPPMRDRTYQHVVTAPGTGSGPSGAWAKEGRIRQRIICFTHDWMGDPDEAMLNWN